MYEENDEYAGDAPADGIDHHYVFSSAGMKITVPGARGYEPRYENKVIKSLSGPFSSYKTAEAFAIRIAGTYNLLQAQVLSRHDLIEMTQDRDVDHWIRNEAKRILRFL